MTELSRTEKAAAEVAAALSEVEARGGSGGAGDARVADARTVRAAHERLGEELSPAHGRLARRAAEVDPESGKHKYNDRFRARVKALGETLEAASTLCQGLIGELEGVEEAAAAAERQREWDRRAAEEERLQLEKAEAERAAEAERIAEKQRQEAEAVAREERLRAAADKVVRAGVTDEDRVYAQDSRVIKAFWAGAKPRPGEAALARALEILAGAAGADKVAMARGQRCLRELRRLMERVVAHPESEACRLINGMNGTFRAEVASTPGARETLAAIGFELALRVEEDDAGVETRHVEYTLHEPDLQADMDGWMAWFDFLKAVPPLLEL